MRMERLHGGQSLRYRGAACHRSVDNGEVHAATLDAAQKGCKLRLLDDAEIQVEQHGVSVRIGRVLCLRAPGHGRRL